MIGFKSQPWFGILLFNFAKKNQGDSQFQEKSYQSFDD
jgi:hypothetical protein